MAKQQSTALTLAKKKIDYLYAHKYAWLSMVRSFTDEKAYLHTMSSEFLTNPGLLECTDQSILDYFLLCASMKLMPGSMHKHIYPVPFKIKGTPTVVPIFGYQGKIEIGNRHPDVKMITYRPVFKGDEFDYEYGMVEKINIHRPGKSKHVKDDLTHTYSVCHLMNGGQLFHVCTLDDIEESRNRSKAKKDGPWVTDYVAMAARLPVHRLFGMIPKTSEARRMEQVERDVECERPYTIDGQAEVVENPDLESPQSGAQGLGTKLKKQKKKSDEEAEDAKLISDEQLMIDKINTAYGMLDKEKQFEVLAPDIDLETKSTKELEEILERCNKAL